MVSLEELKSRVSTTLFVTGAEINKMKWGDGEGVPDQAALDNTTICLVVIDGHSHVGSFHSVATLTEEFCKDGALDDALSQAVEYFSVAEAEAL